MKTYICTGIGDMMSLDTVISPEEKVSISEIYWACRFGKNLIPLFENNPEYPNLKKQHIIDDEIGKKAMATLDPVAVPFWHFRPDMTNNFQIGLRLFGIENEEIQVVDAAERFLDVGKMSRSGKDIGEFYYGSSFIRNSKNPKIGNYILFHYPTSTRPRNDISTIDSSDWDFVEKLSNTTGLKVIVVSDCEIDVPLTNYSLFINPDIKFVVDLASHCDYYTGCDSFCGILASNRLPKEKIYMKTHDRNIKQNVGSESAYYCCHFLPHSPNDIAYFYKPYIGEP